MDPNLQSQTPVPPQVFQPAQSIPTVEPTPVTPPPTPQKSNGILAFGIILLSVSLLTLVGYFVYQNYQLRQTVSAPVSISPAPYPINIPDITANWQTYTNSDLSFKYPDNWVVDNYSITSNSPKVKLVVVPNNSTLMNECMEEISSQTSNGYFVKKFTRVTTGQMCGTTDATPREIWVIPSSTKYAPGISYQYSSTEAVQAEKLFDQILSTLKFTEALPSPHVSPLNQ